MKKSDLLRLKQIIMNSKDYLSFKNSLNLDNNSLFLCLLDILQEAIVDYNPINDYEYLTKAVLYLKSIYLELSKAKRDYYKKDVNNLKKIYKKYYGFVDRYDQEYFHFVYQHLENIFTNKTKDIFLSNQYNNLYKLIYETIFTFQNLEYLDLLMEKSPDIINLKENNQSLFLEIINEYIITLKDNKTSKSLYFIRVINKFIHSENLKLSNEERNKILQILNDFLNSSIKLSKYDLDNIKSIIICIKNQCILNNYNINLSEYEMSDHELDIVSRFDEMVNNRINIRENIITIDDPDTTVLDDGISILKLKDGHISVKVHIADPLGMFSYNSRIIQDAKERTTTIYDLNPPVQMLPNILSSNKLSLLEGKPRLAKTFSFEYSKDEGIVYFKVINSVITVNKRTSYDEINEIYKKGGTNENEELMFACYDEILSYLKKFFKNAKLYEEFKRGNIIGNKHKMSTFSESLVGYLMMFTGYKTAEYFSNNGLPYAYRCHQFDQKWQDILDEYMKAQNPEDKKIFKDLRGRLPKSYYSRDNIGHMGLKVDYYSHITSPLRRFSDILNMHCLNTCYFQRPTDSQLKKLEQEVIKTCEYINMQSNSIDEYLSKVKKKN